MEKAIVLCSDNAYLDKLTTTLKSVCAHNKGIHFYIFNDDIPVEWFRIIERAISTLGSTISNVKVSSSMVSGFNTRPHINYAAYYRYFIADYIIEDKALYLDSDIIVTNDLTPLFELDLEGKDIAAVNESDMWPSATEFNSGVLLINTKRWRENNISELLMQVTEEHQGNLHNGDQQILNLVFKNSYLAFHKTYNYLIGYDLTLHMGNQLDFIEDFGESLPTIIHYITDDKPWNHFSNSRLRELWWYYYFMDWGDISSNRDTHPKHYFSIINDKSKHLQALIYSSSGEIQSIEEIIKKCPDIEFHIASHTTFWYGIIELEKYPNVSLYPGIIPTKLDKLIDKTDVFLDIHVGYELNNMSGLMNSLGKKVYAFENTVKSETNNYTNIFDSVSELISEINTPM